MTDSRAARILFPEGRGPDDWSTRYAAGEVPDRWPYGLDRVRIQEGVVDGMEVAPLRPLALARSLATRPTRSGSPIVVSWEENLALRMAAQFAGSTQLSGIIWATDRFLSGDRSPKDRLIAHSLRRAALLWCLSRPQVEIARAWLGPSAPPIRYLQFGIDADFFAQQTYPERPLIFSAGSDRDRDGPMLFRSLERIRDAVPGATIVVQSTSDLPAPEGVTIIRSMTHVEIREYYRQASVVLVATRPNVHVSGMTVALEAMAVGRPVVTCSTPGMDDYVKHGLTGAIVPLGDSVAMADAAIAILKDPQHAERIGLQARAHVEAGFTTQRMADQLSGWIEQLL